MLQFNFIMIYIVYKVSVLHKITIILKHSLRTIINIYSFKIPNSIFWGIKQKREEKIDESQLFSEKAIPLSGSYFLLELFIYVGANSF